ncbi:MAG: hypothetical protein FJ098_08355 [Deltaproteobacteria bacterium]|nr:hypothetical protein [Deltaproteobacteria bacterium]
MVQEDFNTGMAVLEVAFSLPILRLAYAVRPVPPGAGEVPRDHDPRGRALVADGTALVGGRVVPRPAPALPPGEPGFGTVAVEHLEAGDVRVRTRSSRPGLLVYGDSWYPGWHAEVDGAEVPVYKADLFAKAVEVPSGEHAVRFVFVPNGVTPGAWIAGGTLLAMLAAAWILRRR